MRRLIDGPESGRRHVRVDLRGCEALVPEQLLDDAEIRAALQEVCREAVAQRVGRHAIRETAVAAKAIEPSTESPNTKRAAAGVEKDLGPCHVRVRGRPACE